MISIVQRVSQAHVEVAGQTIGKIGAGLLVLLCAEQNDTELEAGKMLDKILKLRIFTDQNGKMNHSLLNMDGNGQAGQMLIVSQFTLAADVTGGNRPSFSAAAPAAQGEALYRFFVDKARTALAHVATGEFGADMQIHLINNGPVTIPIRIEPAS
ncbi:D-aminoacyl-tRNA deacylase [Saezia sanguinis]|uniref:D-aminoacyl-tRNA deacylase n=1 Tax=Saezia sanguinis TaxID=1965230 RepID=A0A433SAE1_9BURK|nr:D-aminoacyl-tRNA deacylase [Saezia sanguinis]RUS65700.1 D-aminoacyl-tRNA deacylase [Saezia sanguinis]